MRAVCYAWGRPGDWEAICVDFNIAVQADSYDEVQDSLRLAIRLYLDSIADEEPAVRERFLKRRSPFFLRLKLAMQHFIHQWSSRMRDGQLRAGFDVACPA